jgi:hypothetical protein
MEGAEHPLDQTEENRVSQRATIPKAWKTDGRFFQALETTARWLPMTGTAESNDTN